MKSARVQPGFTLVELMVVVGIVAILAAVGVPMYGSMVKKAKADEGQTVLSTIRAKQELYRATRFTYASALSELPGFSEDEAKHGDYFLVSVVSAGRDTYSIRAWDGQKAISGETGGEEWYILESFDEPCRTKSSLVDANDPCVATVKARVGL